MNHPTAAVRCSRFPARVRRSAGFGFCLVVLALSTFSTSADELGDCAALLLEGKYAACAEQSARAISAGKRGEDWPSLNIRALMAMGRYADAKQAIDVALSAYPFSIRLRLLGYDVHRRNGDAGRSQAMIREIDQLVGRSAWRYSEPADRVALGRSALLLGAEPRQVLELFFDRVKKDRPDLRDVYLAIGELGLDKHDYAVAAQAYQEGVGRFPQDADMHFGLAQSFAPSDAKQTEQALETALKLNPNHVPAIVFQAEHFIDSERYDDAAGWLDRALAVDPWYPPAWSYRAVLAHLNGDAAREIECRSQALHFWKTNPAVDHLIGKKLSQKYRFAEGSTYQRRALAFDGTFLPAKIQLAQDLLRLGQDAEGWQHAEEVHQRDRYDVAAYNLVTLRDSVAQFRTIEADGFIVRMEPLEADLYGDRVVGLLRRAKKSLCDKYGLELTEPVTVEIFPQPNDFAVRTFGMPGAGGFLGVCFGKVITANSPASRGDSPANWESVLWHEFAHVVTLQLTNNRMPRWLSEGISVYEERQAHGAWGQRMSPKYREMILGGELTPVGKLSAAFLAPPSGLHLQFAYYESSLVVEFLIERFGLDALRGLLRDLKENRPIQDALDACTEMPLAELEKAFEKYARDRAEQLAPDVDFSRDKLPDTRPADPAALARWLDQHPNSFWGLLSYASALVESGKWHEAKVPLGQAIELYPDYTGADNPYKMLATAHRELGETDQERAVLEALVARNADEVSALVRLIEIASEMEDWLALVPLAESLLSVHPLLPQAHRALAQAGESLDQTEMAIAAYRRVLRLDPPDPADVHYRLAKMLDRVGDESAKRHVLMSLEEAPRFPEALDLLLKLHREPTLDSAHTPPTASDQEKPQGKPAEKAGK